MTILLNGLDAKETIRVHDGSQRGLSVAVGIPTSDWKLGCNKTPLGQRELGGRTFPDGPGAVPPPGHCLPLPNRNQRGLSDQTSLRRRKPSFILKNTQSPRPPQFLKESSRGQFKHGICLGEEKLGVQNRVKVFHKYPYLNNILKYISCSAVKNY